MKEKYIKIIERVFEALSKDKDTEVQLYVSIGPNTARIKMGNDAEIEMWYTKTMMSGNYISTKIGVSHTPEFETNERQIPEIQKLWDLCQGRRLKENRKQLYSLIAKLA